jgi:hypothetical protein
MRGVYETSFKISALAATKTLLLLTVPANKVVELYSSSVTDASNATNQQLEAEFQKVSAVGPAAGTPLTPGKKEQGDQAAASTLLGNLTTEPTSYAANTGEGYRGFPSLSGWEYLPQAEERLWLSGGDTWGLRLLTPTFAAQDTIVRLCFREVG